MTFQPGQSGNPRGRLPGNLLPRDHASVLERRGAKEIAMKHTEEAMLTLIEIMRSKTNRPETRLIAANAILDRGLGKPQIHVEATVSQYDKMSDKELVAFITGSLANQVREDERRDEQLLELEADDA